MNRKLSLESWMIKVVLQNPQTIQTSGPARPALYAQADVEDLVRALRDDRPPPDRRLVDAELNANGQIEAWLTADADKPVACRELAELCSWALPLRRPKFVHCTESRRITTDVDWQG
jgi:hypothetical protein